MSRKLIVVFGATGQQGGSVVASFLKNKDYIVRAVTRKPDSDKAKALAASGAEVVAADLNNYQSIAKAFQGASAAFGVTDFWALLQTVGPDGAFEGEIQQGKNLANAAASTPTLEHYVWSSLPSASTNSKGALSVPHIDSKALIDEYIFSSLPALAKKTTFFWAGFYATNLATLLRPVKLESGKYAWVQPCAPSAATPIIGQTDADVGVFVSAILAKPEITLPSKYVLGSVETLTMGEILKLWGEVNGVETVFVQKDTEEYIASFFAGPVIGKELVLNMKFVELVNGWSKSGVKILTKEDLGIQDAELVSTKQSFERMDWSSIVKA
ncbi:NmrA-like family protein-like protein [Guyanagaster necrorhizus]|uniref:NmrA-like family protein-like protein n=1 Tax=Guyanagaster necrorhizus TaxID=856835 RepID=A0A9P8APZ5_9AGAR|nr:NmrA-like family protein-like protein [Guyanagaster necrorhizus MCA 3950]KAG7443495.1 NmrA-like family protein-like protein [Guyanagaster necrorhizus MCA 3950]